jgi:hypothetical protein
MAQDTLAREVECLISNGCLHLTKVGFLHGYLLPAGTCSPHAIMAEAASGGVRTDNG